MYKSKLLLLLFVSFTVGLKSQVKEINGILMPRYFKTMQDISNNLEKSNSAVTDTSRKFEMIKSDFLVNELAGTNGADQNNSTSAIDGNGNYVIVWQDYRNGQCELYAQFYNNKDEKIGGNTLVYNQPNNWNSQPFAAGNPNGGFIISWAQESNQIVAQMFNTNGEKNGSAIILNTNKINTNQPSVAINNNGYFIIQWSAEDYSSRALLLYYKIFDLQGKPITDDLKVFEPATNYISSVGGQNCTAADASGNFVVVWSSHYQNSSRIFLQVISTTGEKIGTSQLVSDINDIRDHYFPLISSTDDGNYLILWSVENYRLQIKGGLAARLFNTAGGFSSDQFFIFESDYIYSGNYCAASNRKDNFSVVYYDRNWKYVVIGADAQYLQQGSINLTSPGEGYLFVNSISYFNSAYHLALSFFDHYSYDLYSQKLDQNFGAVNALIKVNDDSKSSWQTSPNIHINNQGESIILWEDLRNGWTDLYAQVYDKNYNPVGENIRISETDGGRLNDVKSFSDGTFLIVFSSSESSPTIYFQKVSSSGSKIGSNVKVKQNYESAHVYMSINDQDQVFLCYYLYYLPVHTLYYRKFDKGLTPITSEKVITTQKNGYSPSGFSLSINKKFNILTTWLNRKDGSWKIENKINGLIYNSEGKAITDTIILKTIDQDNTDFNTSNFLDDENNYIVLMNSASTLFAKRFYNTDQKKFIETIYTSLPYYMNNVQVVSFTNHKSLITWKDGNNVMAAFLNDNRRDYRTYILQTLEPLTSFFTQASNAYKAALFQDKIFLAYESRKNGGTGYDIWGNVQMTENMDFGKEPFFPPVDDDILYTNFPNPFNSQTKIAYEILAYHPVKLTVYDILGKEVKVLVNENQEKGLYEVNFDASELASGIYFYRLEAFRTITKKMIVIK